MKALALGTEMSEAFADCRIDVLAGWRCQPLAAQVIELAVERFNLVGNVGESSIAGMTLGQLF